MGGYDSHLFVRNLGETKGNIECVPDNEGKYISFSKYVVVGSFINKEGKEVDIMNELRFIDSFNFINSSLEKVVSNLSLDKLRETEKVFKDKIKFVSRKGVYPYDYIDSITNFNEKELLPKKLFYSKLNNCDIFDDYEHANKVWNEFRMKMISDCHDYFLKSDVLLWRRVRRDTFLMSVMSLSLPGISPLLDWLGMLH